jgi:hypothetical protein
VQRCPFAPLGLGSDLLAACPGFLPVRITMGHGPGAGLGGQTCGHIASASTGRGFAATCLHPEADQVVLAARVIAADISSPPEQDQGTLLGRHSRRPRIPVQSTTE